MPWIVQVTTLYISLFQLNVGRRAMGALSVKYGTLYTSGNIAEAICKYL